MHRSHNGSDQTRRSLLYPGEFSFPFHQPLSSPLSTMLIETGLRRDPCCQHPYLCGCLHWVQEMGLAASSHPPCPLQTIKGDEGRDMGLELIEELRKGNKSPVQLTTETNVRPNSRTLMQVLGG